MHQVEKVAQKSSHLNDHWIQAYLVAPPMIDLDDSELEREYNFNRYARCLEMQMRALTCTLHSGVGWKFSLIIQANDQPPRKYSPAPDFFLMPVGRGSDSRQGFWPVLLGKVKSDDKESDRWRMLLQLAGCARINSIITRQDRCFVVQGVYVNRQGQAERYLAYAKVEVSHDLTSFRFA